MAAAWRPTTMILNAGHHLSAASLDLRKVRTAAVAATDHVVWKTTTLRGSKHTGDLQVDINMRKHPVERAARAIFARDTIFESRNVTRGMSLSYWDRALLHYRGASGIYRALNEALVHSLVEVEQQPAHRPRW